MSTRMLVPAALAVALGFSSWSVRADYDYVRSDYDHPYHGDAPVVKTTPATATDIAAAQSTKGASEAAMRASKPSGERAPHALVWPGSREHPFRTGIGPANMFQLRENAGG